MKATIEISRKTINEIKKNNPNVSKIRKENVGYMVYWSDSKTTFFESPEALLYFFNK